jgi:hypothetical protein
VVRTVVESFHDYLADLKAVTLSHGAISLSEIVDDYFNIAPPLAIGEKRKEFADAIAIETIRSHMKSVNQRAYLISDDPDFESACERYVQTIYCQNLQTFLSLETSHHESDQWVDDALDEVSASIEAALTQAIESATFYLGDQEGDVEDVEVSSIQSKKATMVALDVDSGTAVVFCRFSVRAKVSYDDPELTRYDREDGRAYSYGSIEDTVDRDLSGQIQIEFGINRVERKVTEVSADDDLTFEIDAVEYDNFK